MNDSRRSAAHVGLTASEVEESRARHGENVLTPPPRTPMWRLYLEKYDDPIIRILLVAAAVSLVMGFVEGEFVEAIGIFIAIFLATTIGFYFERDAARRFDVLTSLGEEQPVKVVRDGRVCEVARREVVVGDVVVIETGDEVPADGRLIEAGGLEIDESALTGEPMAAKRVVPPGGDRDAEATYPEDVVLRSTMVMGGTGRMEITAVGDATEIGRVARRSSELTAVKTPLNMQLDRLASMISRVGTGVAVAAFVIFLAHDILTDPLWHTDDYVRMAEVVLRYFMMSVTLIVMAVPEGLPMAVTLALALNMRRMLKTNNLVRKLHACETMGAVTVICTDKTGTLTQNRMTVADVAVADGAAGGDASRMLDLSIAMNTTAELDGDRSIGNPTEGALLRYLKRRVDLKRREESGERRENSDIKADSANVEKQDISLSSLLSPLSSLDYKSLRSSCRIVERLPFSTERKYMATLCDLPDGGRWLFVKGAPEIVMGMCDMPDDERERITRTLTAWQGKAMRTLAFAMMEQHDISLSTLDSRLSSKSLTLQAVVAISDPLREEVPAAVAQCRDAGIEVKIVTGDTSATALEIARQIGIIPLSSLHSPLSSLNSTITGPEFAALSDDEALALAGSLKVMSRARPADKQRLVQLLQRRGEVVAVTGDGTNDAPALNHAHVGLSLGSGTSVAKNASDMTLIDDSFGSIVRAVQWGRSLYRNIRRFIFFQLVVNVTALLLVLGGSLVGTELPLTITQMLWVNLIMDTFAAMALASLPPETDVMRERPRRRSDFIISRSMAWAIGVVGTLFFAVMIVMLFWFERVAGLSAEELTVFFTFFVMLQWWNLFNAKAMGTTATALRGITRDRGLLLVLAIIIVGQWLIVTFGGRMFRTVPLSAATWLQIVALTSPVLIVGELWRAVARRRLSLRNH